MPVILSGPLGGVQGPGPPLLLSAGPVLLILPALLILAPQLTKGEIIATNLTARPDFQGSEPKVGLNEIEKGELDQISDKGSEEGPGDHCPSKLVI